MPAVVDADDTQNATTDVHEAVPSVGGYHDDFTGGRLERLVIDHEAAASLSDDNRGDVRVPMLNVRAGWIRWVLADEDGDIAETVFCAVQQAQRCAIELKRLHVRGQNHVCLCLHDDHPCLSTFVYTTDVARSGAVWRAPSGSSRAAPAIPRGTRNACAGRSARCHALGSGASG